MLMEAADSSTASVGAAQAADEGRHHIRHLVPHDPLFVVRIVLMSIYGLVYIWWFRSRGLIIDRISVGISVGIFLSCAFVGKPWRRWGILVVDAALYATMWFCYEMTRGAGDRLGFPYQVEAPRNIDRFLFFGTDPNVWIQQRFYEPNDIRWYDGVASSTYYTHFIVPVIAMAVLWATSRVQWVRFMKRFASLLLMGCIMFVVMPTVPPWMASSRKYDYQLFPPLARHTGRGFQDLGFHGFVKGWQQALDWGNAVAAMPSLHTAFSLFVPAFFLPMIKPVWLKAVVLMFPVVMLASLVYFGEHWVIDGIIGAVVVGVSFLFWNRVERRQRRVRAERALASVA
ncbi:MAG: phosphatase PAP2 family protein [Ilumatobacteraceae bacterium]